MEILVLIKVEYLIKAVDFGEDPISKVETENISEFQVQLDQEAKSEINAGAFNQVFQSKQT